MLADVVSKRTSCNSAELPIISRNLKIQSNLTAIAGNSKGQRLLKVDREAVDEALQYLDGSVRREGI